MPVIKLFVGSSSGTKSQAKKLIEELTSDVVEFLPWWDAFTPGKILMHELDAIRDSVQGAIFVFSPDAEAEIRGVKKNIPNLNVLFEFGYFYGHLGPSKVAMIKYGDFYLPSDFGGYVYIKGSKYYKRNAVAPVGKGTRTDFKKWIQAF